MLYRNYLDSVVASVAMLIMAGVIALVANLYLGNPLTVPALFTTWASAFFINYIAALFLPVSRWSARLCAACKTRPGTLPHSLINAAVITLVYNSIISAGMTLLETGFTALFWGAWLRICPVLFLPGILATVLVSPLIVRFSVKMTGVSPPQ